MNRMLRNAMNMAIDDPITHEELAELATEMDRFYVQSAFRALFTDNDVEKARDRLYNVQDRDILQETGTVCTILRQLCQDVFFDQEDE